MWPFSPKQSSLLIAIHDGALWRAREFHFHHGQWHAEGMIDAASRNGKKLPKQILDFAVASDIRRVRILVAGELHTVNMDLPQDAENEELHTALVYEAAEEIGVDAHMLRIASVCADYYQMGGEHNQIVTAGFDAKVIEGFAQECERAGLRFDGIGSLEMAVLARHARLNEEMRLLFLRRQTGLYVVPGFDTTPFMLSSVAFGFEADATDAGHERMERTGRRFDAHKAMGLRIVSGEPLEPMHHKAINTLVGAQCNTEHMTFAEIEEDVLRHVAWAEVGGTTSGCALIGPPPKPRDPYRAGSVVCGLIILLTLAFVGIRWHTFDLQLHQAHTREAEWKTLESERKKAQAELSSASAQYQKILARQRLLESHAPLPPALMPILNTLSFEAPRYTRITEITQQPDGVFIVKGVTRWQEGLRLLAESFGRHGLKRDFSSEAVSENGEQQFTFTVQAGGEK